jgi:hypothetical protein
MNDREEYKCGGAYRAMLKIFREAKKEMEKEKYIPKPKHQCLRCQDLREVWVWKDTSETEKIRVDCPMCTVQRPPQELRDLGII